jgi:hypothetical protein
VTTSPTTAASPSSACGGARTRLPRGGFGSAWNHDYPRAEQNLSLIMQELTEVDIRTDGSRVLMLDDPELFRYPIAFMWEPGFWVLTEPEAETFRAYLQKGGFAVFEDFDGAQQWNNFEAQMRACCPTAASSSSISRTASSTPSSGSRTSTRSCTRCLASGRATTASSRTTIRRSG